MVKYERGRTCDESAHWWAARASADMTDRLSPSPVMPQAPVQWYTAEAADSCIRSSAETVKVRCSLRV